jgi:SAM-dependent methyltransferase
MRGVDALLERTFHAEQRHFWFRGFKRFVAPLLQQATAGLARPRVLDAGCGTGTNLIFLRRYGNPYGLELHWRGLQLARERGLPGLTQGSVAALPYVTSSIDVVVSFDVLYCLHAAAEASAISEMYRVLKPGGVLIVNVAAMKMLKGDHSVLGGEVRRYSRDELKDKLQRAGFRVSRLTYTNAVLFPVVALVRGFQRLRGLKGGDQNPGDFAVPPAPVNALFSGLLAIESVLVTAGVNMPVGSSLLCLARKPSVT